MEMLTLGSGWGAGGRMGIEAPLLDTFNYPVNNQPRPRFRKANKDALEQPLCGGLGKPHLFQAFMKPLAPPVLSLACRVQFEQGIPRGSE